MQNDRRILGLSSFALLVSAFAAAKFLVHILTGQTYGYFCDELYTIAVSKHLALGYTDLPPLVPALHALSRVLFGESLLAIHIFPSLAGAATLVFVCLITRELGGKLFATGVAALGFIIAPVWLILDSFFGYDSIDQLVLSIFLYFLVRLIRTENRKLWIALGIAAGIAFITKATILFLGPGLLIALLASKHRRQFLTPWPWFALGIFFLIISPYVIWEYVNHWPTLAYWGRYSGQKLYHSSIPEYAVSIALTMNAVLVPLIGIGLYRIFRPFGDRRYWLLGVMFLATMVMLFVLHARAMMLAELCVPLIAAGAVWLEEVLTGPLPGKRAIRVAAVSCMVAGGILVAPVTLPLLPLPLMKSYTQTFGFLFKPVKDFNDPKSDYPQEFSNRLGWDDLVRTVALVYHNLPPEDQAHAGIFCEWFGPAGAVDLLGPRYGLPHAVTGSLSYYRWGPGDSWDVMIFVSADMDTWRGLFGDVQEKAAVVNEFGASYNQYKVYVCRKPTMNPKVFWAYAKGGW